jgi:hypothetical protein
MIALRIIAATTVAFATAEPAPGQVLITHRIPAALAMEAVEAAVAACTQQGYGVTATVIDADAQRIASSAATPPECTRSKPPGARPTPPWLSPRC